MACSHTFGPIVAHRLSLNDVLLGARHFGLAAKGVAARLVAGLRGLLPDASAHAERNDAGDHADDEPDRRGLRALLCMREFLRTGTVYHEYVVTSWWGITQPFGLHDIVAGP